jgi:hypothetical protein
LAVGIEVAAPGGAAKTAFEDFVLLVVRYSATCVSITIELCIGEGAWCW